MTELEPGRKYLYNANIGETFQLYILNKEPGGEYSATGDIITLKSGDIIRFIERLDRTYKNINNRDKIIGYIEYIFKQEETFCGFRIIIENEQRMKDLITKFFIPQQELQGGGRFKKTKKRKTKKRKTRSRL